MNIGLALGSGSSRGWSHIGIIRALADLGIEPGIICGTSIGALVGASYVSNKLEKLEKWVCSLTKFQTARFFEINSRLNGFVNTERLHHFLEEYVANDDTIIEEQSKQYASVATDLESGREVWLRKGSMIEAVWSSISLPGLFPAIRSNDKWLVDGGLVNPVPVSVCRALGADIVIAVNLNGDIVGKHFKKPEGKIKKDTGVVGKITDLVVEYAVSVFTAKKVKDQPPSLFEAIAGSVNITQDRITRSRMAADPPDILLSPKLSYIGLLEFYRADEAISEGKDCVRRMSSEIKYVLSMA
ncbi:MAG: patatin-like phospholipase family protein [Desulfobacterales bacterium]|nr:patatin-like phospholipase family protein [Desulfobacterales bacterium]